MLRDGGAVDHVLEIILPPERRKDKRSVVKIQEKHRNMRADPALGFYKDLISGSSETSAAGEGEKNPAEQGFCPGGQLQAGVNRKGRLTKGFHSGGQGIRGGITEEGETFSSRDQGTGLRSRPWV